MKARLLTSTIVLTILVLTIPALVWATDSFTIEANPTSGAVYQYPLGNSASYTITVRSFSGLPVTFGVTGLPPGTTATFNPPSLHPSAGGTARSTLKVTLSGYLPVGSYPLNVTASDGSGTRWVIVYLNVLPLTADFGISVSPSSLAINAMGSKTAIVTVHGVGLLVISPATVVLNVTGLPANVTATFMPPGLATGPSVSSSMMRINVGANANSGTYLLTIIAYNGTLTRSTPFILTIACFASIPCLAVSPKEAIVYRGDAVNYTIHVFQPANTVGSLSVTGGLLPFGPLNSSPLPTGFVASFAPSHVQGSSISTLTIQTSRSTPFGFYSLTIHLVSDSSTLNRDISLLIVKAARDEYSISASPSTLLIAQGYSGESWITARVLPLTEEELELVNMGVPMLTWFASISTETQGSPPSVRLTPWDWPVYPNSTQTLAVTVNQDVAPGNYTIRVGATWYPGTEENETRQVLIPLTVVPRSSVIPPPTNPQTTNATLEYDLTNRLSENGTCTYAWGPMLAISPTYAKFQILNFTSTSPIEGYFFGPGLGDYEGALSCTLGPSLHPGHASMRLSGENLPLSVTCLGCSGQMSYYVLLLNHDPTVTPHVTLEVAVKLYATTTTTTVSPPPSTIPFIGVPEILLAVLLGFFVVARMRRRKGSLSMADTTIAGNIGCHYGM